MARSAESGGGERAASSVCTRFATLGAGFEAADAAALAAIAAMPAAFTATALVDILRRLRGGRRLPNLV